LFADELLLTPSAARILGRCRLTTADQTFDEIAGQLVLACLEEESLAGAILRNAGVDVSTFQNAVSICSVMASPNTSDNPDLKVNPDTLPAPSIAFLNIAAGFAHQEVESNGISSEHLLAAVFEFDSPVRSFLQSHGLSGASIVQSFGETEAAVSQPLPIKVSFDFDESSDPVRVNPESSVSSHSPGRVLDACMNRAREGLRVLEDYARFVRNDAIAVERLKTLRHRLADSERGLATYADFTRGVTGQLSARNIAGDVGTQLTALQELSRSSTDDIVHANARRVQESLRSLEEFGKLVSSEFAQEMKQLRYDSYQVHQLLMRNSGSQATDRAARSQRLEQSSICVLVTESGCRHPWKEVVTRCLDGGADIIQLREKNLDDSDLLERASWVVGACQAAGALTIVNDRADIASLSGADGVHLGQDDLSVAQSRRLIGDEYLIGLSTHSVEDIQVGSTLDVDYLGIGPVFPSTTKDFNSWVGVELLRDAASCELPWLAIGGIQQSNLGEIVETGACRVAVSAAVIAAEKPEVVVAQLVRALTQ